MTDRDELAAIWDYYKPRQLHAWNMLVFALNELERKTSLDGGFETEYAWENVIIRLWLYRTVVRTLLKLSPVSADAETALEAFDANFQQGAINCLKALRDMIEHFDDYAADEGRGPAKRVTDLDPWRTLKPDAYIRGQFTLNISVVLRAAHQLNLDAKDVSDQFILWYKNP